MLGDYPDLYVGFLCMREIPAEKRRAGNPTRLAEFFSQYEP
jgi:hypothetical protein